MFSGSVLSVLSSFVIILLRKIGSIALLLLSSYVVWLLEFCVSSSQCHDLWSLIVVVYGQTQLILYHDMADIISYVFSSH